ncbi:putative oxygen-independent coproporphyrinogen-3 oxidase [Vitreoscilla sp. C1]|uniref:radical SAM family heme chaperone HemW n=1 Tax=Vitreoscilla sp. (strain C1) TaxID=96942 RepID=UPI000CDC9FE6|nr:radical SAM family heme chaperone HemW [Vitreoscilla sp. C1]AUZ04676.1 putative oxygen-independent coproporphyrinogen-3 oxidase [Vitreoscilla sp. C1]
MIEFHPLGSGLKALPPLSLYIHTPWCVQKCPYCDFNSHQFSGAALPEDAYVDALLQDLEQELPYVWGRSVETIFIGGGTPSVFQAASIDRLLAGVRARIKVLPTAEITMEANPGTFEQERFAGFADAGINRLSLGVQSFHPEHLKILGRIHDDKQAKTAIEAALKLFERINIDLMYALPNQSIAQALNDVNTAMALGAPHISAYQLTLEPNTAFGHTPPANMPDDDHLIDIEEAVHGALFEHGFTRYETSAFQRDGKMARHNVNYWQFGDYIGIGAGAHGKISYHDRIERTVRVRHPKDYFNGIKDGSTTKRDAIDKAALPFEFMMNALRLQQGVPSHLYTERTGLNFGTIAHALKQATEQGLLEANPTRLQATPLGQRFLNDLLQLFL